MYVREARMTIYADRLTEMVANVRLHAATPEHVWDVRALDWPLTRESVVVEVGGYTGRWALQIAERYHPQLYVFEPQPWAHAVCQAALGESADVFPYGLGDHDGVLPMGQWETDGCSLVNVAAGAQAEGRICEIGAAFRRLEIGQVDLLLMNIEGYEYTLLPYMLDCGILPKRLLMQWHLFGDPWGMIMAQHWARLEQLGYRIAWTYGLMLTAWERD
jgi:FkbM family methyltransferase